VQHAISRFRAVFAIVLYLLFAALVAVPWLAVLRLRVMLSGASPSVRRSTFATWMMGMAATAFRIMRPVLGVRARFDLLGPRAIGGYLVLANHRSSFDIPIIAEFLRRNGLRDARWVLKAELQETPVVGTVCRESGCAFVGRTGSAEDLRRVEYTGIMAAEDGANVVIFPEGTVFSTAKRKPGYTNVLPPKAGGVSVLRRVLSQNRVLVLSINWTEVVDGRNMWKAHEYVGKILEVRAKVLTPAEARHDDVRRWLEREWKALDSSL